MPEVKYCPQILSTTVLMAKETNAQLQQGEEESDDEKEKKEEEEEEEKYITGPCRWLLFLLQ